MKIDINGVIRDMTPDEKAQYTQGQEQREREYWSVPYDEAVDREIRRQYTASAEFALLRQKDEKPEEYRAYFDYCEQCKAYVKAQQAKYAAVL